MQVDRGGRSSVCGLSGVLAAGLRFAIRDTRSVLRSHARQCRLVDSLHFAEAAGERRFELTTEIFCNCIFTIPLIPSASTNESGKEALTVHPGVEYRVPARRRHADHVSEEKEKAEEVFDGFVELKVAQDVQCVEREPTQREDNDHRDQHPQQPPFALQIRLRRPSIICYHRLSIFEKRPNAHVAEADNNEGDDELERHDDHAVNRFEIIVRPVLDAQEKVARQRYERHAHVDGVGHDEE